MPWDSQMIRLRFLDDYLLDMRRVVQMCPLEWRHTSGRSSASWGDATAIREIIKPFCWISVPEFLHLRAEGDR